MLFLISAQFDTEVLCDVVNAVAQADNLIVMFNRPVLRVNHTVDSCDNIGLIFSLSRILMQDNYTIRRDCGWKARKRQILHLHGNMTVTKPAGKEQG